MLEAFVLSAHTIKTQSSRSKVILKDAKQAYRKDIDNYYLETKEDEFGESRSVRKKGFERKSFGMSTQRLASKFYDDFILSEWIKEHGE
jgi:hypothetical protein